MTHHQVVLPLWWPAAAASEPALHHHRCPICSEPGEWRRWTCQGVTVGQTHAMTDELAEVVAHGYRDWGRGSP
jgi:hypothetical protein